MEIRQCDGGRAMSVQDNPTANASIPESVSQLSAQTSRLVRDEMRLAQKEFQESARHAGIGAGLISIAGLFAVLGAATLVAAAVAALSLVLAVWAAAVIVAAALFLCALVAALVSRRQVQQVPMPAAESVDSVKLDIEEIKDASHGHH